MNATSASATIGLATNHSVALTTVHCLGRGAQRTFLTATLRRITSAHKSFAVILSTVGQRAALHGRTDGLNAGLPSLPFSPKLNITRAFSKQPSETYRTSAYVLREGAAPGKVSPSNGLGVRYYFFGDHNWRERGMHLWVCKFYLSHYATRSGQKIGADTFADLIGYRNAQNF